MPDASRGLYDAISQYSDLEDLIANGEVEGLYLECKAPGSPNLGKDLKATLAKAISGFSNTAGGVIIWGVSTTPKSHGGLDVLAQIEPIGKCSSFLTQIVSALPRLTNPPALDVDNKTIKEKPKDTKGVVVSHIPKMVGDPVQSIEDNFFYYRSGDGFSIAPYEMIKRLFSATDSPDLHSIFVDDIVKLTDDEFWEIPIVIQNKSSAVARDVLVSLEILNPSACESIQAQQFSDHSNLNIGKRIFHGHVKSVIHRGMNFVVGTLKTKMKVGKRAKRVLRFEIGIYADRMRARKFEATVQLAKKGFSANIGGEQYLY